MTYNGRALRLLALAAAGAALTACAPLFPEGLDWRTWLHQNIVPVKQGPVAGYYEDAVTAIHDRHYALALDYLQAARVGKPEDVRILTAFGVVYDKLGRFDLSARYYARAAQLDPKSTIVAADMAYSKKLQGFSVPSTASRKLAETAPTDVEASVVSHPSGGTPSNKVIVPRVAKATTGRVPTAAPARTGVTSPWQATGPIILATAKTVLLTGHPLVLVNASGQSDPAQVIRAHLAGLRWTVSKRTDLAPSPQQMTTIFYQPAFIHVAQALARTVSFPVHLTADDAATGLRLILGRDFLESKYAGLNRKAQHIEQVENAAGNGAN